MIFFIWQEKEYGEQMKRFLCKFLLMLRSHNFMSYLTNTVICREERWSKPLNRNLVVIWKSRLLLLVIKTTQYVLYLSAPAQLGYLKLFFIFRYNSTLRWKSSSVLCGKVEQCNPRTFSRWQHSHSNHCFKIGNWLECYSKRVRDYVPQDIVQCSGVRNQWRLQKRIAVSYWNPLKCPLFCHFAWIIYLDLIS